MQLIKVVNWEKWQSYRKDRGTPPWIKVHRNLLSNPEWASLSDSEKGKLVLIWILAADKKGTIPSSPKIIQKMCQMDTPPNLNKYMELGFLASSGCQGDVNLASHGLHGVQPETETETELPAKERVIDIGVWVMDGDFTSDNFGKMINQETGEIK